MSQTTTNTVDKLYCLTLFMSGLQRYPGARRDALKINREVNQLMKRFEETADIVTQAETDRVQELWEHAAVLDLVYRQSALDYHNVGNNRSE